jgi:hypothetical protein
MERVEADLNKSKQVREKQAREFQKQLDDERDQQFFSYIVAPVLLVKETRGPGENLSQVTDKLYHIMLYTSP